MCMVFALNGKDSSLRDKTRCIMILNSSDMSDSEYIGLILQLLTLEKVKKDYPGKTIENILVQIRARLDEFERQNKLNNGKEKAN